MSNADAQRDTLTGTLMGVMNARNGSIAAHKLCIGCCFLLFFNQVQRGNMFFKLGSWDESSSAWRLMAIELSKLLENRKKGHPLSNGFIVSIERWLGKNYIDFFQKIVDELDCMGSVSAHQKDLVILLMSEYSNQYPGKPSFSGDLTAKMLTNDLGI